MKNILVSVLSLFSFAAFAQLELKKTDGTPINNGDVFTFTSLTEPGAYLGLKIYNTSDEDIMIKARVVDIENSNGTNLQLCVGDVCLLSITEGNTYPNFPATIPANGQNGNFDHFVNYNPGIDPTQPVTYTIKILMVDDAGQDVGNSVQFTYQYLSPLSTDQFTLSKVGVALESSVISDMLNLKADFDTTVSLFAMDGKAVGSYRAVSGSNSFDVAPLQAGVYIARFSTADGRTASTRIVKN